MVGRRIFFGVFAALTAPAVSGVPALPWKDTVTLRVAGEAPPWMELPRQSMGQIASHLPIRQQFLWSIGSRPQLSAAFDPQNSLRQAVRKECGEAHSAAFLRAYFLRKQVVFADGLEWIREECLRAMGAFCAGDLFRREASMEWKQQKRSIFLRWKDVSAKHVQMLAESNLEQCGMELTLVPAQSGTSFQDLLAQLDSLTIPFHLDLDQVRVSLDDAAPLSRLLSADNSHFRTLRLRQCVEQDRLQVLQKVVSGLRENTHISFVDLHGLWLGGIESARLVADLLAENTPLRSLSLSGTNIGTAGMLLVWRALRHNHNLQTLDVSGNGIGDLSLDPVALSTLLGNPQCVLRHLNLSGNRIQSQGAIYLAIALLRNRSLRSLSLRHNLVSNKGMLVLAQMLKMNQDLEELDLAGNTVDTQSAIALGAMLSRNRSLRKLDMSSTRLAASDLLHIFEGLRRNEGLRSLKVAGNAMDAKSVQALRQSLLVQHTLRQLDLSQTLLGDAGILHLAPALAQSRSLTSLNLDRNAITNVGGAALASMLRTNTALVSVSLQSNRIDRTCAVELLNAVVRNPHSAIQHLNLRWNRLGKSVENPMLFLHGLTLAQAANLRRSDPSASFYRHQDMLDWIDDSVLE